MRFEGEAFVDPSSCCYFGVITIVHDNGQREDILRTPPMFPTRPDAEKAIIDKVRKLANDAKAEG